MRLALSALVICVLAASTLGQSADAATKIRVGVLKFGTVSWMIDTIQRNGLDKAEGIELDVMPLASGAGQDPLPDAWRAGDSRGQSGQANGRYRTGRRRPEAKERRPMVAGLLREAAKPVDTG